VKSGENPAEANRNRQSAMRPADVYVSCLLFRQGQSTINSCNVTQPESPVRSAALKRSHYSTDLLAMLRFTKSHERWWQKPLAQLDDRPLPAELAVLFAELRTGESGAWLNSRGTKSGAVDLARSPDGKLETVRTNLPPFVSDLLRSLYEATGLAKGAPDLVIWNSSSSSVRFVEVKCPHWDRPSEEQLKFLAAAKEHGVEASIAEWEFI